MTGGSNGVACRVCGGELPAGAMFCGECGSAARHPGWMGASGERAATRAEARAYERVPAHGPRTSGGSPAPSRVAVERARPMPAPESETTVRTGDRSPDREQEPAGQPVLERRPEARRPEEEPGIGSDLWFESAPGPEPEWLSEPDPEGPEPEQQAARPDSDGPQELAVFPPEPAPELVPAHLADNRADRADRTGPADDVRHAAAPGEVTAPRQAVCGSLVARFSTGETVTLHGTGLLGRNPVPSDGERFDVLVRIADPARSVSKTHLEFVVDAGRLWIRDRYSGNGTILRHPNGTGSRCEAGRRYRVRNGDRVEIGEQFFDIR